MYTGASALLTSSVHLSSKKKKKKKKRKEQEEEKKIEESANNWKTFPHCAYPTVLYLTGMV